MTRKTNIEASLAGEQPRVTATCDRPRLISLYVLVRDEEKKSLKKKKHCTIATVDCVGFKVGSRRELG